MKIKTKKPGVVALLIIIAITLVGCGNQTKVAGEQVVIHSNADDEAVEAMKKALDQNGYQGKYIFQTFGTSELGGKILAEGTSIEADLVTMSSFYLESAQAQNHMFAELTVANETLTDYPSYYTPITAQEGTIIINPNLLGENALPTPLSIKDLGDPMYQNMISVTDIQSSSTAWLLIQAILDNYGEEEGQKLLAAIYANAGVHMESSGSGPIKKVRAGEVGVGFGLRHQAVADEAEGLPISYSDPIEGNYVLTESIALIDKGDNTNSLAAEMVECIIKNARNDLILTYPIALYEGETVDAAYDSKMSKTYPEKLTVELLQKHQEISEASK